MVGCFVLCCNGMYFKILRAQGEPVPQLENSPVAVGCQAALLGTALWHIPRPREEESCRLTMWSKLNECTKCGRDCECMDYNKLLFWFIWLLKFSL